LANERADRRLSAILAADIAGYSRLMEADEEGTLAQLKACRRELVDPNIRRHHGRIVKTTGDGMLVEFRSIVEAVACAVEVQRNMFSLNATEPEDRRIVFRIGINVGDILIDGDDIFGDGVKRRRPARGFMRAWRRVHFARRQRADSRQAVLRLCRQRGAGGQEHRPQHRGVQLIRE